VQNEVPASNTPMGTSIITDKFSPNVTKKTLKDSVKQETTDSRKKILAKQQGSDGESDKDKRKKERQKELQKEIKKDKKQLKKALKLETFIRSAEVKGTDEMVMIRLKDKAAFKTGKANLNRSIRPTLKKVAKALMEMNGRIIIVGHTDNIPISNDDFGSNWELSSRRATAVLHQMLEYQPELSTRIQAEGHADIDPIDDNRDPMGRSTNRRVEIILRK